MRADALSRPSAARTAWITLSVLCGLNLLNYLDRYVMSAVLTPLQKELRLDDGAAGWIASAFMLGYFVSAPFFGYLGDRFPRRYLMLGGVAVWSVATACSGLAQNFAQLFSIRLFVGFGEACFVTMGPSWISDLFSVPRRNSAITLFYVAVPFGSAIGFAIGGWFAQHGDWRGAFIYTGLPGLLLALSLLFLREPRRGEADHLAPGKGGAMPLPTAREIFGLLRNPRYNLVVWGYTAQTFSIGAFGIWGPAFLHRIHGLSLASAATIFGAMLAGSGLVATLAGGFTATRLRRQTPAGYAWVMAFSLLTALPVCCFALLTSGMIPSLIGLGAAMFLLFLPTGPVTSQLLEIVPVHLRASGVALCTFIMHLFGDWGSPAIVGTISDAAGSLRTGVLILPVVLLLGAALWCTLVPFTRAVRAGAAMKIVARSLAGEILEVQVEGPVFRKIMPLKKDVLDVPWIAPGLVDIQINGFGGIDFNRPLESEAAWEQATQELYAQGCTGFLLTLITNCAEGYRELLDDFVPRLRRDPRNCLGFHMEGPWLNPDPGFRGAHRAEWMGPPDLALLESWQETAGDLLKLITLAPEVDREGSRRVIEAGRKRGTQFFIGHSHAIGDALDDALKAGAVGWTHLGNASPALAPKFDNVLLHALAQPKLLASLIPDGVHLPPHAFRVLARALEQATPSRLLLTTDAMAAAGARGPGKYTLGEVEVELDAQGSARLPGSGRLAGSTVTPFAGVFNAERMAGLYLEDAWEAFSTRPASLLGLRHELAEGCPADFCIISPEKTPYLLATYQRGKCVYEAP